tara:strand:- start:1377 stop:2009 length:633 start_codon:yes stop_codon:yes gene_type:complete
MLELGKKSISKVKGLGKKVGNAGLSVGKKVIKTGAVVAGVVGTGLQIHSSLTGQSVGDSAVDLIETGKDLTETGKDVVSAQRLKADIERVADEDKTKLQKAKEAKELAKKAAAEKNERNRKRQEGRIEKPKDKAERERKEKKEREDKEKQRKDREDKSRIARQMAEGLVNMKTRERNAKREECYKTTKSGKKGRFNLSGKDKQKCDKKHK